MAKKNNQRNAPAQQPVQTNAGANPMGSPKPTSLGQVLRVAGGGGGIGRKELKSILEEGGKNVSGGQVVKRLDKINTRLAENDLTGINLKSGAANMLIKQAGPAYGGTFLGMEPMFGTGRLGKELEGMRGTRTTGGYPAKDGYGEVTPGTEPTRLARGMDLMPSGRQTVRGVGKQYEVPSRLMQPSVAATTEGPAAGSTSATGGTTEETVPAAVEPTAAAAATSMDPFQTALANWAQGFRGKKSSRKQANRSAQGYNSMLVNAPKTNVLGM
jgi:hypothetical protein